jgi:hypothetical protein
MQVEDTIFSTQLKFQGLRHRIHPSSPCFFEKLRYEQNCLITTMFYALYRVAQKTVNLKYFLLLTGMFGFKLASQFSERYHSVVSCAPHMEDLVSNNFVNSSSNKEISDVF